MSCRPRSPACTGGYAPAKPRRTRPRIELSDADPPELVLDANGLATGGIRTPWIDVPVARTSGVGSDDSLMSAIFGSGELLDADTLRRLYPGGTAEYLDRFKAALDTAIRSGFIVPADRREILELAALMYPWSPSRYGRVDIGAASLGHRTRRR